MNMENLAKDLLVLPTQENSTQVKTVLTQLSEAINGPEDTTCLIGPVMKLLPSHNVDIKKEIHKILPKLCKKHPEVAVLAANSIQQDCADLNPVVKCLGVTTLAEIPEISEHAPNVLVTLLSDGHPRVRLATVQACKSFNSHSSLTEHGIIDILYSTVRDQDPQVATTALLVLDSVLVEEGGVIVTKAMAKHLLKRLSTFPPTQLVSILQALAKYKPKAENELFEELSILDSYLIYKKCAGVTVNCICLFLTLLTDKYDYLVESLVTRSIPTLTYFLTSASETSALCVLEFLTTETAIPWFTSSLTPKLIPVQTDKRNVQIKKFSLLPKALSYNKNLCEEILTAIKPWCQDTNSSEYAVNCVCQIRTKCPEVATTCLDILINLLANTSQSKMTLLAMEEFNLEGLPNAKIAELLDKIVNNLDLIQVDRLPAILPVLLGLYGELLPNSSYILEHMVNSYQELPFYTRKNLLTALLRMFIKQPAECQLALGRLLCQLINSNDMEVTERAKTYYKLLAHDPDFIRDILFSCGSETMVSSVDDSLQIIMCDSFNK